MSSFPKLLEDVIEQLCQFPGIGRRSAERIAFHLLKMKPQDTKRLAQAMVRAGSHIKPCRVCNNFTTRDVCRICADNSRDQEKLCIVEEPKDLLAIEKTSQYRGLYYVLLGAISPLEGVGPENINIGKLLNRLKKNRVKEVIIATDPDNDGELTAHFLVERISKFNLHIYRIGMGIPLGTQIEYIDPSTLGRAMQEKKTLSNK
jgi:recombination protein RecR